jgi:hypothetical protein
VAQHTGSSVHTAAQQAGSSQDGVGWGTKQLRLADAPQRPTQEVSAISAQLESHIS